MKLSIELTVNGETCGGEVEPRTLLVQFLRDQMGLTGTHVGCVVGECGACSVLVDGQLVKSCLMLAVQANGCEVTTIEGLRAATLSTSRTPSTSSTGTSSTSSTSRTPSTGPSLHPIQAAFVDRFGLQCGYCTPGFIMATHALLARNPHPTEADIRRDLSSNLCMCTGYMQIVEAVKDAAGRLEQWRKSNT